MSAPILTEVRKVLDKYPPSYIIKIPDTVSIRLENKVDIGDDKLEGAVHSYLDLAFELIKKREYYRNNNRTIVRAWLSKIYQLIDSLENIILLCNDSSDPLENEISWIKAQSIEAMVLILEKTKDEIGFLRGQIRSELPEAIREKVAVILVNRFALLFEVLINIIAVENGELPATEIVLIIGKAMTEVKKPVWC